MLNPVLSAVNSLTYYIVQHEVVSFLQEPQADHVFIEALTIEAAVYPHNSDGEYFGISREVAISLLLLMKNNEDSFPFMLLYKSADNDYEEIGESDLFIDDESAEVIEFDDELLSEDWTEFFVCLKETYQNQFGSNLVTEQKVIV
jgi:hypothetical protein